MLTAICTLPRTNPCSISFPPAGLVNCGISARYKIAALGFNRLVISPCGTVWPALQPPWGKDPPDRYLAESERLSPNSLQSILRYAAPPLTVAANGRIEASGSRSRSVVFVHLVRHVSLCAGASRCRSAGGNGDGEGRCEPECRPGIDFPARKVGCGKPPDGVVGGRAHGERKHPERW